ncbi:MAG: DNA-formamidopyrimidine glycosylase family protein [Polyangiaceae bacterium]|jgi:formamidopyrimidine-DNA glycosylase
MPELPDVEMTRRDLERWLVGAIVTTAETEDARLSRPASPRGFEHALVGRTFERVERRGKWLRLDLDDGGKVFSHLGMTGGWVRAVLGAPVVRFERARIDVVLRGRAFSVRYVDARRFGRLLAVREDIADWTALGPDPLTDGIDVRRLSEALARGRRSVKEIVMDQRVFAGVGNILANEGLWIARIDPRSAGNALLLPADARAIARGLRRAIARELADRKRYTEGRAGSFFVYGRAGQPCLRCGKQLSRVVLGGRATVFCPGCQVSRPRPVDQGLSRR